MILGSGQKKYKPGHDGSQKIGQSTGSKERTKLIKKWISLSKLIFLHHKYNVPLLAITQNTVLAKESLLNCDPWILDWFGTEETGGRVGATQIDSLFLSVLFLVL